MANVEIYKIKKTAPPHIREYSVFDYMRNGETPNPLHYVREWAGEMYGTLPLTIPGKLMLDPPQGYHGGDIQNGDIAVVNGTPYFMDKLSGSKFVEVDFNAAAVKDAVHIKYGWHVDITGAEAISDTLSYVCDDLGIPVGYLGEPMTTEVFIDRRPFLPGSSVGDHLRFLHPDFMKGEEACTFVTLLSELTEAERWTQIFDYLRERYPVNQQDLDAARERFAPELLLPERLRPMSKVIPVGADKSELAYLSARIGGMNDEQRKVFDAVIAAGWHCGSVADIINITENLDRFELQPVFNAKEYGASQIISAREEYVEILEGLEQSMVNPAERDFFIYFAGIEAHVDLEAYGEYMAEMDGGEFTTLGYLTTKSAFQEVYRGPEYIPSEYRTLEPFPVKPGASIMVNNTDLPALLIQMHALGGDYMRDAKHNLQIIAGGKTDFLVMINEDNLTVTPADTVFRRDMSEHETLMMLNHAPDIRMFVMSVAEREDGRITGNLCEVELSALRNYILSSSSHITDPADERLTTYLDVLREAVEANRTAIPAALFLSQISEAYMAQSHEPQPGRFRVAPEAARDIVAQNAADVFKIYPEPFAQMTPIDAAKPGLWTPDKCEFSIRHGDWEKLEKWAHRAAGEMLRQTERGDQNKSRDTEL